MDVTVKNMHVPAGDGSVLAVCDLELGGEFLVKGVRVMARHQEGGDSLFVAWPMRRDAQGTWRPIAFPVSEEAKGRVSDLVEAHYIQMLIDRPRRAAQASQALREAEAALDRGR